MATDDARRPRRGLQGLTWLILGLSLALTLASALGIRAVVADQKQRQLQQRVEEANLVLQTAVGNINSTFASLATEAKLVAFKPQAFESLTAPLTGGTSGAYRSLALVKVGDGAARVVAISGTSDLSHGSTVGGPAAEAIAAAVAAAPRATASKLPGALVATPVFATGDVRHYGFAFVAPAVAPGYAILTDSLVDPFRPSPSNQQAYKELALAIYAGPRVDDSQLLVAANVGRKGVPLDGQTESATLAVGFSQPWLLVAKARQSLVGSVADATPWAVLVGGLLASLLIAWTVEVVARRRSYALDLVKERTAELQQSLTELGAAQEQLVRQERLAAIGELASTVGHELRNPLAVLSNAMFLLRADLGDEPPEATVRHLATAEREISAATVIVSDLLEFARERKPVPTDVELGGLVNEVLGMMPAPGDVEVRREIPATPVTTRGDRDQLRQVLLNLVGNAYQAMPEGGTVTITAEQADGVVQVTVADTGVGISDDVRPRLFEPFFTTKARGVGLGLAVTRRIVEAHHGDITVDSAPDCGTAFRVVLPALAAQRTPRDSESAAERGAERGAEVGA